MLSVRTHAPTRARGWGRQGGGFALEAYGLGRVSTEARSCSPCARTRLRARGSAVGGRREPDVLNA